MALNYINMDILLTVLFVVTTSITKSASIELYPPSWKEVCTFSHIDNDTMVNVVSKCVVRGSEQVSINLKELHEYSKQATGNITYSLDVLCRDRGNITMTWPMKIDKLVNLKVKGCNIYEFIDDWSNPDIDKTDTLLYLEIIDTVIVLDIRVIFESLNNALNISREWRCAHDETIIRYILRNTSFDFGLPNLVISKSTLPDVELLKQLNSTPLASVPPLSVRPDSDPITMITNLIDVEHKCDYSRLIELEESYAKSMNKYQITVITGNSKFPRLQHLNLSHNGMDEISEILIDWRLRFRHLKYMDLSHNRISKVNLKNRLDVNEGNDTIIDVSYNNITVLMIQDLLDWAELKKMFINIRGNPLDCGCFKQDFILKIQDEGFFVGDLLKYKYIRNMTCASPESARGVTLAGITKVEMGCSLPPADLTVSMIILGVVAATLILVIVLTFWYRKEIKIMLYIKFNILLPWDVDDKKEDKRYDAFVSYSSGDEDWVYDYLQTHLETPANKGTSSFSLCLHQRDFIGGTSILENIINSIDNSRHTIVILSKNFLKSVWGMEEFRHAYYQSIVKKHRHLIIIKYENIPEQLMDATLKRCLKTFTYIDIKDNMFLDRLRFALAIKTRPSKVKKVTGNIPHDLILPGPLIITDDAVAMNTQVSNSSEDSGCFIDIESGFNGHVNQAANVD